MRVRTLRTPPCSGLGHRELGGDVDGVADAACHRAVLGVQPVGPLNLGAVGALVEAQLVADVDAFDDQDAAVEFDLAFSVGSETTVSGGDVARLERAPEGADQSTRGGGHDVVEGGRVRGALIGRDAVVLGDFGVHPERHRVALGGEVGVAKGSTLALDAHLRPVRHLTHHRPPHGLGNSCWQPSTYWGPSPWLSPGCVQHELLKDERCS
jgi:hypothetical protein